MLCPHRYSIMRQSENGPFYVEGYYSLAYSSMHLTVDNNVRLSVKKAFSQAISQCCWTSVLPVSLPFFPDPRPIISTLRPISCETYPWLPARQNVICLQFIYTQNDRPNDNITPPPVGGLTRISDAKSEYCDSVEFTGNFDLVMTNRLTVYKWTVGILRFVESGAMDMFHMI